MLFHRLRERVVTPWPQVPLPQQLIRTVLVEWRTDFFHCHPWDDLIWESAAESGYLGPDKGTGRHRCRRRASVLCYALPLLQPPLPGPAALLRQPNPLLPKAQDSQECVHQRHRTTEKSSQKSSMPPIARCCGTVLAQGACMQEERDTQNLK